MTEFVAEAISKCTIHKRLLFFGFTAWALATLVVSANDQTLHLQRDALKRANCRQIYEEYASGKTTSPPELEACLRSLRKVTLWLFGDWTDLVEVSVTKTSDDRVSVSRCRLRVGLYGRIGTRSGWRWLPGCSDKL